MRRLSTFSILALVTGLCVSSAACSSSDAPPLEDEVGEEVTTLPSAVGFVFVDYWGGPLERCAATLISSTTIATDYRCLSKDFAPTTNGGPTPTSVKLYFVGANQTSDRSQWIEITSAKRYQHTALGKLAKASPLTPVAVSKTPLGAADVGKKLLAPVVLNPSNPTLKAGTTVLRATTGQGMKTIYPTFAAFKKDYAPFLLPSEDEYSVWGSAWQRPLINDYQVLTKGTNEASGPSRIAIDSLGAPLLRKVSGSYELVGLYSYGLSSQEKDASGDKALLATYYTAMKSDVVAFLGGKKFAENHCLGVPVDTGICLSSFTLNCIGGSGAPGLYDPDTSAIYCGKASQCKVSGTIAVCK